MLRKWAKEEAEANADLPEALGNGGYFQWLFLTARYFYLAVYNGILYFYDFTYSVSLGVSCGDLIPTSASRRCWESKHSLHT